MITREEVAAMVEEGEALRKEIGDDEYYRQLEDADLTASYGLLDDASD